MKTQSLDTHPDTERILISLLRKKNVRDKVAQICSLSQETMMLSKRAIARANSGLTKWQVDLLFIELHYGGEIAEKVKSNLERIHGNS